MASKQFTIQDREVIELPKPLDQLSNSELERKSCIGRVMTYTLRSLTNQLVDRGFQWLLPVALSQSTDPLWPDPGASIEKRVEVDIYGKTVRTTTSMIIHKLIAASLVYQKLFILSPNIRIEKAERAYTGKHIYEFTQLDFEVRDASSKDVMRTVEDVICNLLTQLKRDMKEELTALCRCDTLTLPKKPFKVYDRAELEAKYGACWEEAISKEISEPVWITNIPREFYDFEDFKTGKWDNYDLFMPQFGEVLSGAKREWDYEKILKKIERDKVNKSNYALLLKLAKEGKLKPSAGGGIGIERLVGWISGVKHIAETQPFPRVPGTVYEL
ncbi:MAG: asparagine synthetase A [Candidatus Bathyarchaeota archaeon]|nr:asparagine synthetase A [Candidatus Bathyarchaeota archaeon]